MNKEISLQEFFNDFKDALISKTKEQVAPLYKGTQDNNPIYTEWMKELKRAPFDAQENAVQALLKLLIEKDNRAGVLCGDMGTGKTIMAIALLHCRLLSIPISNIFIFQSSKPHVIKLL